MVEDSLVTSGATGSVISCISLAWERLQLSISWQKSQLYPGLAEFSVTSRIGESLSYYKGLRKYVQLHIESAEVSVISGAGRSKISYMQDRRKCPLLPGLAEVLSVISGIGGSVSYIQGWQHFYLHAALVEVPVTSEVGRSLSYFLGWQKSQLLFGLAEVSVTSGVGRSLRYFWGCQKCYQLHHRGTLLLLYSFLSHISSLFSFLFLSVALNVFVSLFYLNFTPSVFVSLNESVRLHLSLSPILVSYIRVALNRETRGEENWARCHAQVARIWW